MFLSKIGRLGLLCGLSLMPWAFAAFAATTGAEKTPADSSTLSLNGSWQFALAPTEAEANALSDFHRPDFHSDQFKPTPVPSNWAVLGYEEPVYSGFKDDRASEGFYRRDFDVPADWKEKHVLLHFGGVWSSAEAWLNGKYLGRHDSGYNSFAFDASKALQAGATNHLAVRVRQVHRSYKFDVYDDWTLGGIYRDVTLEAMPRDRWLDNITVQTSFDDQFQDADLKLVVMVADKHGSKLPGNYPLPGDAYDLRFTLSSKDGATVFQRQLKVDAHTATHRETRLTARIERPLWWTAETPHLYTLKIDLLENGKVAHSRTERVGFRQISTAGGVFRINGQAVKLRGVNRHDEHPDVGRATTREQWLQDITLMKAANINYIRLAHYPPAKGFIELCDELGMYVGEEVSLGGAGELMYDPSLADAVLQRSYETVTRDLNNPSIIYWSIGNEDPLTSLHMASIRTVKALDPTRPVLMPWRSESWLPPEIDILAPHYWKPQEYDQLAAESTRPIISTEYTHAYGNEGMGTLDGRWKALTQHPSGAGAAIWMWADQGLKTPTIKPTKGAVIDKSIVDDKLRVIPEGWDGIVDSYRKPTLDYWEAQAVYAPVYPGVQQLSFLPGQSAIPLPIQNDYDFTDLGSVKITWQLMQDDQELAKGSGSLHGKPHATAMFDLPLTALKTTQAGKSYYAWLTFSRKDGSEITRRTVELLPSKAPEVPPAPANKLSVTEAETVTVQAGDARYVFSPESGQLISADWRGAQLLSGIRPTLWHTFDASERFIMTERALRELPDLDRNTAKATSWSVAERANEVLIHAAVDYVIDSDNRFTTEYVYKIATDGSLGIDYQIKTKVKAPWLPSVGLSLQSEPRLQRIRWLGLGPYDAYPNKRAAAILGVWSGAAGSNEVTGIKAIRWAERNGAAAGFRVHSEGYMEHQTGERDVLRILSSVVGRPEKGRKADESFPQLTTNTNEPFIGSLKIELKDKN